MLCNLLHGQTLPFSGAVHPLLTTTDIADSSVWTSAQRIGSDCCRTQHIAKQLCMVRLCISQELSTYSSPKQTLQTPLCGQVPRGSDLTAAEPSTSPNCCAWSHSALLKSCPPTAYYNRHCRLFCQDKCPKDWI
jgi:hypothetical protein